MYGRGNGGGFTARDKREWYRAFYSRAIVSPAYKEFCGRVYGRFLCQDGMAHSREVELMADALGLGPGDDFLELGCGSGMTAEYLSDMTGARGTAVDNVPEAIQLAVARTRDKAHRLGYRQDDLAVLDASSYRYNVVLAVDVLYFTDARSLLARVWDGLSEGGRMGLLHSVASWSQTVNTADDLDATNCAVGRILTGLGIRYRTVDLTPSGLRVAEAMVQAAEDLKERFSEEGNLFIYETKSAEGMFSLGNHRKGMQKRYLFHAVKGT